MFRRLSARHTLVRYDERDHILLSDEPAFARLEQEIEAFLEPEHAA